MKQKQKLDEYNDGVCECGHHSRLHSYTVITDATLSLECSRCNCKDYKFKEFPRERHARLRRIWQKKWRATHRKEHLANNSKWRKAHRKQCNEYLRKWIKKNYKRYCISQIKYYSKIKYKFSDKVSARASVNWWKKQLSKIK